MVRKISQEKVLYWHQGRERVKSNQRNYSEFFWVIQRIFKESLCDRQTDRQAERVITIPTERGKNNWIFQYSLDLARTVTYVSVSFQWAESLVLV